MKYLWSSTEIFLWKHVEPSMSRAPAGSRIFMRCSHGFHPRSSRFSHRHPIDSLDPRLCGRKSPEIKEQINTKTCPGQIRSHPIPLVQLWLGPILKPNPLTHGSVLWRHWLWLLIRDSRLIIWYHIRYYDPGVLYLLHHTFCNIGFLVLLLYRK